MSYAKSIVKTILIEGQMKFCLDVEDAEGEDWLERLLKRTYDYWAAVASCQNFYGYHGYTKCSYGFVPNPNQQSCG